MPGYSNKSLADKLGIRSGDTLVVINAPADYVRLVAPMPKGVTIRTKPPKAGVLFVHLFVTSIAELEKTLPIARKSMTENGMLWVSWYKKAAKIPTDVTEDIIRKRALKTDLVDVKVCAVSDELSGLKLVVRKSLRQMLPPNLC